MQDNGPKTHRRRTIRLRDYDYSQPGAYFVTICTQDYKCLFGKIEDQEIRLNDAGQVVDQCWKDIPSHFPYVTLDDFVIMPNHIHGILLIGDAHIGGAKNFSPLPNPKLSINPQPKRPLGTSKTLGSLVRGFKIGVSKWMRQNTATHEVWQRNYWEHIVRSEPELNSIREYIHNNPAQWELDKLHPDRA